MSVNAKINDDISRRGSRFEALVTLDAAQPGEVHACLAIYAGFTRGILSPYSRLCRLVCGYIVNKMQRGRWRVGGGARL